MTDLAHEANHKRAQVVEACRSFVEGVEGVDEAGFFDMQRAYHDMKQRLWALEDAERRMQREATA